jgi:hypothetical protein
MFGISAFRSADARAAYLQLCDAALSITTIAVTESDIETSFGRIQEPWRLEGPLRWPRRCWRRPGAPSGGSTPKPLKLKRVGQIAGIAAAVTRRR